MKIFIIRIIAIVMAAILLIGAVYTCCIATYMWYLSCEVANAEVRASSGDWHARQAANKVYADVMEEREELYYGGGYKSWFSTAHKIIQILLLLISGSIICISLYIAYGMYKELKERKARKIRRAQYIEYRRLQDKNDQQW